LHSWQPERDFRWGRRVASISLLSICPQGIGLELPYMENRLSLFEGLYKTVYEKRNTRGGSVLLVELYAASGLSANHVMD
jgi:hypothetical protein